MVITVCKYFGMISLTIGIEMQTELLLSDKDKIILFPIRRGFFFSVSFHFLYVSLCNHELSISVFSINYDKFCLGRGGGVGGWQTPLGYYWIRSMSGRYASYWNAFLLVVYLPPTTVVVGR